MPSRASDPHRRLIDIRDNIRLANSLEIISEASKRLPAVLKERHPGIEWSAIAGAGNVFRHDYEAVEKSLLRRTVHERLPQLLAVVEEELSGSGE